MKLSKYLADKFEAEFEAIYEKEKMDKDFLSQEQFDSCIDRAKAGVALATESLINDLAYAIAVHREKEHSEDTLEEQAVLLAAGAEPEIGTLGFWSS